MKELKTIVLLVIITAHRHPTLIPLVTTAEEKNIVVGYQK